MSKVTLEQWDRLVAPRLSDISHHSSWIEHYSDRIAIAVAQLPMRPDWNTKAEVDLTMAIDALEAAHKMIQLKLDQMKKAQQDYKAKEVEK